MKQLWRSENTTDLEWEMASQLGELVRHARTMKGMTLERVAIAANFNSGSAANLNNLEHGRALPNWDEFARLSDALDLYISHNVSTSSH